MIDIRYHIASIVAVFLALGLGILIGSTIVGDDLLVDQQKKVIDRLEQQFEDLRTREAELTADSEYKSNIINKYENYSQAVQPLLIQGHLKNYKVALVVCGDSDMPASLQNTLSVAGAQVVSKTVVLGNMKLDNTQQVAALKEFYKLDAKTEPDAVRRFIATSVGSVIAGKAQPDVITYLQSHELVRLTGDTSVPVNGVIVLGGSNNLGAYYADSFDRGLISYLTAQGIKTFGVETSRVTYSAMENYQKENITTVDDVDLSPGQVSLVLAMEGETGNYGMKPTAQKFMPSLTLGTLTGE